MAYGISGTFWCDECADKYITKLMAKGVTSALPARVEDQKPSGKPIYCHDCGEFLKLPLTPQGIQKSVCDFIGNMPLAHADGVHYGFAEYTKRHRWNGDEPYPLHMANVLMEMRLDQAQRVLVSMARGILVAAMKKFQSETPIERPEPVDTRRVSGISGAPEWIEAPVLTQPYSYQSTLNVRRTPGTFS